MSVTSRCRGAGHTARRPGGSRTPPPRVPSRTGSSAHSWPTAGPPAFPQPAQASWPPSLSLGAARLSAGSTARPLWGKQDSGLQKQPAEGPGPAWAGGAGGRPSRRGCRSCTAPHLRPLAMTPTASPPRRPHPLTGQCPRRGRARGLRSRRAGGCGGLCCAGPPPRPSCCPLPLQLGPRWNTCTPPPPRVCSRGARPAPALSRTCQTLGRHS